MLKITVLIADDHMIVREGLKQLLQTAPDIEVVGEAENGVMAVCQARELQPRVVLLDIAMPKKNGIDAARQIRRESPASRVLMLSTYHHEQEVHEALEAGAAGYMMKEGASLELLNAVRQVSKGQAFFSPVISRRMERQSQHPFKTNGQSSPVRKKNLTGRELQVLKLIADGKPNKAIAADLGISIKTVEKHRQSLMDKLHIHESAGVTRYAIATGLVPCARRSLLQNDPALNSVVDVPSTLVEAEKA